jgi:hypothetical protein
VQYFGFVINDYKDFYRKNVDENWEPVMIVDGDEIIDGEEANEPDLAEAIPRIQSKVPDVELDIITVHNPSGDDPVYVQPMLAVARCVNSGAVSKTLSKEQLDRGGTVDSGYRSLGARISLAD